MIDETPFLSSSVEQLREGFTCQWWGEEPPPKRPKAGPVASTAAPEASTPPALGGAETQRKECLAGRELLDGVRGVSRGSELPQRCAELSDWQPSTLLSWRHLGPAQESEPRPFRGCPLQPPPQAEHPRPALPLQFHSGGSRAENFWACWGVRAVRSWIAFQRCVDVVIANPAFACCTVRSHCLFLVSKVRAADEEERAESLEAPPAGWPSQ